MMMGKNIPTANLLGSPRSRGNVCLFMCVFGGREERNLLAEFNAEVRGKKTL